jgi:hypothetical protein
MASAQQAYALWGWIEKLSGPGPFVGVDFPFPFPLSNPPEIVDEEMNNKNLEALAALGVETVKLPVKCDEFLDATSYQSFLNRELGLALPVRLLDEKCDGDDLPKPGGLLDTFLRQPREKALLSERVKVQLGLANKRVLVIVNERLRQSFRRFSSGPLGLFCGFRPVVITDANGKNTVKNLFFTLSVGFALTYQNHLRYPDGFAGDQDVLWLSVFPALEYRHKLWGPFNVFGQVGPAAHYFAGGAFDDFLAASGKLRAGIQYKKIYVGAQFDYFFSDMNPERFGALANEGQHRRTWGLFFGIDLTRSGRLPTP